MKKMLIAFGLTAALASSLLAKTVVEIAYPYPFLFKHVHQELKEKFEKQNPDIEVKVRPGAEDYEDATQKVLRDSITNRMPDISFQGLNRFRIFVDKGLAVDLAPFIKNDPKMSEKGFNESMYAAGRFGEHVYGIPFAVSLPIAYYNMDLVKKAGWDVNHLPNTWEEVIALSKKINALKIENKYGMAFQWDITGNWLFQALNFSQGGKLLSDDEKKVAFTSPIGRWSMATFQKFFTEAGMPNRLRKVNRADFINGNVGVMFNSTSDLFKVSKAIGDKFKLKTHQFPGVISRYGHLPAGGNGPLMLTKDPEKQKAAWKVIKFWCGPEGSKVVAKNTGYMPPNQLGAQELVKEGFYENNPNNYTAVEELPLMTKWYAFPGDNALKITEVIYKAMQSIADGSEKDSDKVVDDIAAKIEKLIK
ncbi:MAG TPA: ABC transporter substrate-binding protein [Epsilonproteobacteria bacterium]|nr:ABC transporter substrate-binding protein [Campylobacterota bacterium]